EELDGNSFTSTIPATAWTELQPTIDGEELIDGASPMLERRVSARELASGIGSPELVAVGLDPATVGSVGGLNATNGDTIDLASLPAGSVVLSQSAADELGAASGDQVELFTNGSSQTFTIAA